MFTLYLFSENELVRKDNIVCDICTCRIFLLICVVEHVFVKGGILIKELLDLGDMERYVHIIKELLDLGDMEGYVHIIKELLDLGDMERYVHINTCFL